MIKRTYHGMHGTKEYRAWANIKKRCLDPNCAGFKYYGGKGVQMHTAWAENASAFLAYVGKAPSPGHSLDRIDNSLGYVPGNVRWATRSEQANNKSNNVIVQYEGRRLTLAQLADEIITKCEIPKRQMMDALYDAMWKVSARP